MSTHVRHGARGVFGWLAIASVLVWSAVRSPIAPAEDKPKLLVAPFGEKEARAAQRAWAAHLNTDPVIANKLGMRLALIPPGEFQMGSSDADVAALVKGYPNEGAAAQFFKDERPQHRVRITQPYWLGVFEVTQQEWETEMGSQPSYFSRGGGGKYEVSELDTSRFPVERVSWDDATEFCRKLSEREGKTYRLPTEAEWEYACRAGTPTAYHFGDVLNGDKANVNGFSPFGTTSIGKSLRRSARVGSYRENSFGLYDMLGNVQEWCRDWYDEAYYTRMATDDPENTKEAETRVMRGGSSRSDARFSRSASRFRKPTGSRDNFYGFRVLCLSR